jgi:RNA polymerase-binding transcription factor DksA
MHPGQSLFAGARAVRQNAPDDAEAGAFGVCCKCGEAIAKSRLESDLGTPFCAGCQTEMEEKPVRPR